MAASASPDAGAAPIASATSVGAGGAPMSAGAARAVAGLSLGGSVVAAGYAPASAVRVAAGHGASAGGSGSRGGAHGRLRHQRQPTKELRSRVGRPARRVSPANAPAKLTGQSGTAGLWCWAGWPGGSNRPAAQRLSIATVLGHRRRSRGREGRPPRSLLIFDHFSLLTELCRRHSLVRRPPSGGTTRLAWARSSVS